MRQKATGSGRHRDERQQRNEQVPRARVLGLAENRTRALCAGDVVKTATIRRGPLSESAAGGGQGGAKGIRIRFSKFGPRYTTMHTTECPMFMLSVTKPDFSEQ